MSLITLSRCLGSGSREIAEQVAQEIGVELYDDDRLQHEAVGMGIGATELKSLDAKMPGLLDRIWSHRPELFQDIMEAVIYEVSRRGEGVILGHGSQFLLRDFGCALHIFLYASEEKRIQRICQVYGLSESSAQKFIKKSDHEQRGYLKYAFHMEWEDRSLYDLIINTEKLGTGAAVDLIVSAAKTQMIQECSLKALETMEKMSLTKKVEAELLRNNLNITSLHVDVMDDGMVHLRGFALNKEDGILAESITKKIPGVGHVQSEIVVRPTFL